MSMLQNALSGLKSSQILLDTASNNIANVNTPGYTRQEGVLASRLASSSALNPGDGVRVTDIRRLSNQFAQDSVWRSQSESSFFGQRSELLTQAEGVFGSEGLSISGGIDSFFESLNSAASQPQSDAIRQQIITRADSISQRFNQISENLDRQAKQIDRQIDRSIPDLNKQLDNFSDLNRKIVDLQANNANTSQLEDQRNELLQKLSESMAVDPQRHDDGRIDLSLETGEPLVLGRRSSTLSISGSSLTVSLGSQSMEAQRIGGKMGALIEYRDNDLNDLQSSLDAQAANVADKINNQLTQGYDLNANPGQALFQYSASDPASTLSTTNIGSDELAFIGDSAGTPSGGPGDNNNLLAMIEMKDGFYSDYNDMVSKVGIETSRANAESKASTSLLQSAEARRDNVSAVNQDEEAMDLVSYTQSYKANAKVISTVDEVFGTLLRMF